MKPAEQPLRGEAAWRASRKAIAERNQAAQDKGVLQRAAKEAAAAREAEQRDRREARNLPHQPGR